MDPNEILKSIPKKSKPRSLVNQKYGIMGVALGEELHDRLDMYCKNHDISKSALIKTLLKQYLNEV